MEKIINIVTVVGKRWFNIDLVHVIYLRITYNVQEAQLMLTNPRDAFRGQSRSPNMVPYDMLGMVSYGCAIVTLSLRRDIRLQKNVVILKSGPEITQGHRNRQRSTSY